jgi:uncharacterized protein YbaR (Trm112 family)
MSEREQSAAPGGSPATGGERCDPRLLELLVCPMTKGSLTFDRERNELISRQARVAYPIKNGVALMTSEAARPLDDETV